MFHQLKLVKSKPKLNFPTYFKRYNSNSFGSFLPGDFHLKDPQGDQVQSTFLIGSRIFLFCDDKDNAFQSLGVKRLFSLIKTEEGNQNLKFHLIQVTTFGSASLFFYFTNTPFILFDITCFGFFL